MAKIKESTLENFKVTKGGATGNTTRLIDNAIQIIFSGKICVVRDCGRNQDSELFEKVVRRLRVEHRLYEVGRIKKIKVNFSSREIELL